MCGCGRVGWGPAVSEMETGSWLAGCALADVTIVDGTTVSPCSTVDQAPLNLPYCLNLI
jgi:hypothetical protein